MNTIKVSDKEFAPFISQETIENAIKKMAAEIDRDMKDKNPVFLVMLNGAFMFASQLFKEMETDGEMSFVKYKSYCGTQSSGNINQLIGLSASLEGRNVVIVEDLIDSGYSMKCLMEDLYARKAASVKIAVMLMKPKAFKYDYKVDYVGLNIGNDFIVGYGLDYNEYGRSYKDIYKIVEK